MFMLNKISESESDEPRKLNYIILFTFARWADKKQLNL